LVEAHLVDFAGDLYGQWVVVRFDHKLRDQIRFSGPDAADQLVAQMRADVEETRRLAG
jgi:riboflavin kinase/FMN adenylyltransferase